MTFLLATTWVLGVVSGIALVFLVAYGVPFWACVLAYLAMAGLSILALRLVLAVGLGRS